VGVTVALLLTGASHAAAPVKPKNGLYQGGTGQTRPIGFQVLGRDSIEELFFSSDFGTCDSFLTASLGGGEPISRRGRFKIDLPFGDKFRHTVRGRFISNTKAVGRIVYSASDTSHCGVTSAKTRFRVARTDRL
jgi:hypothetical protein